MEEYVTIDHVRRYLNLTENDHNDSVIEGLIAQANFFAAPWGGHILHEEKFHLALKRAIENTFD